MGRTVRGGSCYCEIEYAPLPSQARFHASRARVKGFSGPIGSGKSLALCQEAIKLGYVNAGRCGLLGAPTYPMLRDVTQTAILEALERNGIPFVLHKAENVLHLTDTGSRILLRSLEEFERLRGTNLAWFGVDELTYVPEEAWLRLEGRLRDPRARRLCGFAVWTPKGHDWVYRRFLEAPPPDCETVIAPAMENRHILSKVPDFYERLRHSYDSKFFRQEVLGEYLNIQQGRVYEPFERAVHLQETAMDPKSPLLWALDFNVDPMCSVVAQIRRGEVKILDEIVLSRASTVAACEEFANRNPRAPAGLRIYGDATGNSRKTSGSTDYGVIQEYFARAGYSNVVYHVPTKNPPVRDRIAAVNAALRNAAGEVRLRVHPRCHELIRDLEEVVYKEGSSVVDKERDPRRTHLSDALGYLIWREFHGKSRFGEQPGRALL
mgnify:CR=1 FL=1